MIKGGIVGGYYGIGEGGGKNPVAYYYGKDQTRRVGENYIPGGEGNTLPAEFKTTADLVYDGGKTDLLTISHGSDEPNADFGGDCENCILNFPAGRYHLLFQGYSQASAQGGFRVELREIQVGTDDIEITYTTGWTSGIDPARKAYQLIWTDFVVDGTEKVYFLFPILGGSARSHFLRVETVV